MTDLKVTRTIGVADVDDIATGGAILGTGGGGDPYIGKLMAQEAIRRHGVVRLVDVVALAYPCAEQWRRPKGLELVGPRYFGYDLDFQPFTPGAAR
jgi:DUF917 family protein